MPLREEIVQQAMSLAPEDRAFVANALEQSLTNGEFATSEIAQAWASEVERRIDAFDRGEIPATDMQAALHHIRQHLSKRRGG